MNELILDSSHEKSLQGSLLRTRNNSITSKIIEIEMPRQRLKAPLMAVTIDESFQS